jgi:predicted transcriptional regulator
LFIRNCLTERKLLTVVRPEQTIQEALDAMQGHLSLPCVTEDDDFVGMVSKRTIFEAFQAAHGEGVSYEEFLSQPIQGCVDRTVKTLDLDASFEDTIDIIIRHPFVPIVEGSKLIGIVKRGDVNGALSVAFATNVDSHRLLLGMPEMEGVLQRLFTVTHKLEINVITAIPFDAGPHVLNRRLILKVSKTSNLDELVHQLEKAGFLIIDVKA